MTKRNPQSCLLDRIAHAKPQDAPDPRAILGSLGEVVYDWDLVTDRLRWGPTAADVLGAAARPGVETGSAHAARIAPESGPSPRDAIAKARERDLGSGVRYQLHYSLLPDPESRSRVWVEDVGRWFGGPDGRPARAHGVLRIVSASAGSEPNLAAVNHDPLTGALSRSRFLELSLRLFNQGGQRNGRCALMIVSIEGLGAINRLHGYEAGDRMIAEVGRRLRAMLRSGDLIGRYAGGKFAVALGGCGREQLRAAAERLLKAVARTGMDSEAGPIRAEIRIGGVATSPAPGLGQSVFLHAEEALDAARTPGGPGVVIHTTSATRESERRRRRRVAEQIVSALNDRRVAIALEPIVDARTGDVAFYEALTRIRLEDGSALPPILAFSVAEKAGLAPLLDQRALDLALAALAAEPHLSLSVNMSGLTVRDPDWPERIRASLERFPNCAKRLIVEITETCAIEDIEAFGAAIALLKELGARVAMDDFGAGHTSFRVLRDLRLDLIKIDGAFVQNLARSADDRFFVRTLIDLARHVGTPIVAEWVCDQDAADLLREWGVSYLQGELFGCARLPEDPVAPGTEAAA